MCGSILGGFIESRPKPIWPRAGGSLYREKGRLDFNLSERLLQSGETCRVVKIEGIQNESPAGLAGCSEERVVEAKRELGFLLVPKELQLFMIKNLDFVVLKPLRRTGMEISGFLVAFQSHPNLAPLPPEKEFFFDCPAKEANNDLSKH